MLMLLVMSLLSMSISLLMLLLIFLLSKKELISLMFLSPFECGFNPFYMDRRSFSLRFFLIALIFLIFDIELILIFPYLISMVLMKNWISNLLLVLFIFLLSTGLFLEWNQNMLEWVKFI